MCKITSHLTTNLSTITNKTTEDVFDVNTKIEEYVHTHYPNAYKFVVGSDCLTIYNPIPNDLDIIEVNLDVVINK